MCVGKNPENPSVIINKPPALSDDNIAVTVEKNLRAMHAARKAFIQAESSEKIQRALRHNVRKCNDVVLQNGDKVYYKRNDSQKWHGPGIVIGQNNKQVLVKVGSSHISVHTSRIMRIDDVMYGPVQKSVPKQLKQKNINKIIRQKYNHNKDITLVHKDQDLPKLTQMYEDDDSEDLDESEDESQLADNEDIDHNEEILFNEGELVAVQLQITPNEEVIAEDINNNDEIDIVLENADDQIPGFFLNNEQFVENVESDVASNSSGEIYHDMLTVGEGDEEQVSDELVEDAFVNNEILHDNDQDVVVYPKLKSVIMFKVDNSDRWVEGFVYSRGGKVGGIYGAVFNIQNTQTGTYTYYNFDTDITEWQPVPSQTLITNTDKDSILLAKKKELESWKNRGLCRSSKQ